MVIGDAVRRFVGVLSGEAVAPVQIGQLGLALEVDVVGVLVLVFELDVEIATTGPEPGLAFILLILEQGESTFGGRLGFILML